MRAYALLTLFAGFLWAPFPGPSKEPWTPEDYVQQESAAGFEIAPSGRQAVWIKITPDLEEQKREAQLQLTDLDSGETFALTRGEHGAGGAKWSPDSKRIAFLTLRPPPKAKGLELEGPQIWLIRSNGGEAWPLTTRIKGVLAYEWASPETIVFIGQEESALHEQERKLKKDTSEPVDDEEHEPPVRLYAVSVEDGKIVRLSKNADRIQALSVSPDGSYAVTVNEQSLRYGYDQKIRPKVFLWDLESGQPTQILKDPKINLGSVSWQPDSKGFYFASDYTTSPNYVMASESRLYRYDLESGKHEEIPLQTGRGLLFGQIEALPDGVLALLEAGTKSSMAIYRRSGDAWTKTELSGGHVGNVWGMEVSQDGKSILYAYSRANLPEQWYAARLEGARIQESKKITSLNPAFAEREMARVETIRWNGAKNEDVEGLLYYPIGYEPSKKYPLVLMIHGGPHGHDADSWNDGIGSPAHLYAQGGAFVLMPNYHGSSGYGLAFAESIGGGGYYTLPVEDILKGTDHVIGLGLADPENLGTMGWSNGAILSAAIIVKDQRFKAASCGAGGAEWVADWGICAFGQAFSNYYLGKAPIEDPALYRANAPLYEFDKVRTPTIFFHGTEDTAVPPHHSWVQYRTLQYLGKVETKLVIFPGEPHGLLKPAHRLRKVEEELAWFDRHLFGKKAEPRNEAVMEGSMLADTLALARAKRSGGAYGIQESGALIPETVEWRGMQVGRFEVTRKQYAQFDPSYRYEAGSDNFPANGIAYERAKAYCAWLSQKTGRVYRLPTEAEGEKLYGSPGAVENTLDAWAGYAVNPDDQLRLQKAISQLPGKAPLLKEVGTFSGVGKGEMLFDLGGNVAEWVTPNEGEPFVMGGSADQPMDEQSAAEPGMDYVGFRVVLEAKPR
jgi:dipeptidyl aminopeptidase/acylaminoacyl peptidase